VPSLRREVWAKLKHLGIDSCPFANLPEKRRTQWALTRNDEDCVWLKPELVAQIEYTEFTPDGHLRHAKFCGLRDDKEAQLVFREG
jgi:ATP-dependent DNA ligase